MEERIGPRPTQAQKWSIQRVEDNLRNMETVSEHTGTKLVTKAQTKLNLVKDIKDNKGFYYKCMCNKRKTRENVSLLFIKTGDQVTQDMEKAKVPNTAFIL